MPATKRSDREVMLSFRVPRELHERLKRVAEEQGRGIATEIRQRLEASLADTGTSAQAEPQTRHFTGAINFIAGHLKVWYAPWYADTTAFEIFKTAIEAMLAYNRPPPGTTGEPEEVGGDLVLDANDPPAAIGRALASMALTGNASDDE